MSEKANEIIESAIAALRAEAEDIQNKIAALQGALSNAVVVAAPSTPAPRKTPTNGRRKKTGTKRSSAPAKDLSEADKRAEAANKRAASWTPEKKRQAAERMKKYWADRKKKGAG